jgi:replicative DNA helicase
MSKEQLIQRLLAIGSGVDQQRLRTGWIEDNEWERVTATMGTLSEADIWIDDTSTISTIQLRSKARRWILEHGLDLIVVDYLQLMQASSSDGRKQENRVQEVSAISRALKGLARELNIPVLALAQLSRAVENRASKVPQLSDLRESGSLEADSDVVLFIYRDDAYNPASGRPDTADIIIAKHRNGPVGEVCLAFDKPQARFRDITVSAPNEESASTPGWQDEQEEDQDDEITLEDEEEEDL